MKSLAQILAFFIYVSGIVIANGFWSTILAIFFPPWGWYLVAEKFLIYYRIIT